MGRFGGSTPKRHRLWSNDPDLLTSIAGRAGYMSKQEMEQCVFRTVRKCVDGTWMGCLFVSRLRWLTSLLNAK